MGKIIEFTKEEQELVAGIDVAEHLTDLGNCKRFITETKGLFRYLFDLGKWSYFDGQVWKVDRSGDKVSRAAEMTVRSIYKEAAECDHVKTRLAIADHARRSESAPKIKAMLQLSEPRLSLDVTEVDPDPWLLNCQNGVIDLKTGQLLEHSPNYLIDKMVTAEYCPTAECPEWLKFLDVIMQGDREMVFFLQKVVGYCLTGITDERAFFVLHGSGKNGKSVFCETLASLFSGYSQKISSDALLLKRYGDDGKRDLASLRGIRFVFASETAEGRRLAENKVKEITGQDTVEGRFLYHEKFEYKPIFKLLLHTNHKPDIRGTDAAIWDRVRLIPFDYRFDGSVPRRQVDEMFEREFAGILRWAVDGCLLWLSDGLETPEPVLNATKEYRNESDVLAEFIEDRLIFEGKARVVKGDLYEEYIKWAEGNKEYILSKTKIGQLLKERGVNEDRTGSVRYWVGVGLKE
jgi:putative DNA primase/helicase